MGMVGEGAPVLMERQAAQHGQGAGQSAEAGAGDEQAGAGKGVNEGVMTGCSGVWISDGRRQGAQV